MFLPPFHHPSPHHFLPSSYSVTDVFALSLVATPIMRSHSRRAWQCLP